jgi:hypothetical protein
MAATSAQQVWAEDTADDGDENEGPTCNQQAPSADVDIGHETTLAHRVPMAAGSAEPQLAATYSVGALARRGSVAATSLLHRPSQMQRPIPHSVVPVPLTAAQQVS